MVILITASGAVVIMTMPWLPDTEAQTYLIGEKLVGTIISPTGGKSAA